MWVKEHTYSPGPAVTFVLVVDYDLLVRLIPS